MLTGRHWLLKPAAIAALGLVGVALAMQVSSMVFFGLADVKHPLDARPLDIYRYWKYWSHIPSVEWRLFVSAFCGATAFVAPVLVVFKAKKRSLHGDARWATHADIRKAGLLD